MKTGVAVFFEDIGLGLDVEISGLVFFTMAKLQAVTLILKTGSGIVSANSRHFLLDTYAANWKITELMYCTSSLSSLETSDMKTGVAVFFEDIGLGLDVEISGLVFFTMAKLQAVTLILKTGSGIVSANSRHFV
ncbi:hypothetical protein G9A89_020181 [Geosiphon pyriformis]|nr:hypothetical protein G9A89_020181 [Geosiphon pyriformis]